MNICLRTLLALSLTSFAWGGEEFPSERIEKQTRSQWRFGLQVKAEGGSVTGITATLPVPMDWPEQKVKLIEEKITPPGAKLTYRVTDNAVKQMVVTIPKLSAGEEALVVVTFEIDKIWQAAPEHTEQFTLPKSSRGVSKFLGPSPYIETTDPTIKRLAQQLKVADANAWDQTHSIFSWVRTNIRYEFAEQIKPIPQALADQVGDCEELSSLFIACCRLNKIPARAVWVPGHTYPEFYLDDEQGRGAWYPCQAAGEAADFGRMPEDRPILQKGDNFKFPEDKTPQRYAKQTLKARNAEVPPQVKFIMEPVGAN